VGPAPLDTSSVPLAAADAGGGAAALRAGSGPDLVRGVRDYVPGDPRRLVSWSATARHGRLMVKELEDDPVTPRLTVVVDLRGDPPAAEVAASRAAGLAMAALRDGAEVVLATAEASGPRLAVVSSAVQVGRRLARATADGPPATPGPGGPVHVVRAAER